MAHRKQQIQIRATGHEPRSPPIVNRKSKPRFPFAFLPSSLYNHAVHAEPGAPCETGKDPRSEGEMLWESVSNGQVRPRIATGPRPSEAVRQYDGRNQYGVPNGTKLSHSVS